jgi:hypothetical protein
MSRGRASGAQRGRVALPLAVALLLALAWLSPRAIPFCMDEFVHYHALGCAEFPLSRELNTFRESCGALDLRPPGLGVFLPLRSYQYIGSLPAIAFWPFWRALGQPVAARVQGAVFLLLAVFALARLARVPLRLALLASLVYPVFALAFLVDLGPVGLSLLMLSATLGLARAAALEARRARGIALAAAAGVCAFLGLWIKLVFAWCLPAVVLFGTHAAIAPAAERPAPRRRRLFRALAFGAALLLPSLLLLLSRDRRGDLYLNVAREGNLSLTARNRFAALRLGRYLVDGSDVIPRTLTLPSLPVDLLPALVALGLLAGACLAARHARGRLGLWLGMAVLTFAASVVTRSVWGPHHLAFSLYFLVGALALALDSLRTVRRWAPWAAGALVALYWGSLALRLPLAFVNTDTSFEKDRLLAYVRDHGLDADNVEVHANWGTFYISHLFGSPRQVVLFIERLPLQTEDLAEVRAMADRLGRGVLVITLRSPLNLDLPPVRAALGRPLQVRRFGRWWLYEFLRATPLSAGPPASSGT